MKALKRAKQIARLLSRAAAKGARDGATNADYRPPSPASAGEKRAYHSAYQTGLRRW